MGYGTPIGRKIVALNNCAFVSTENIAKSFQPFVSYGCSMLGVGVGFGRKVRRRFLKGPNRERRIEKWTIPDTREGWVESVRLLLDSYSMGTGDPI